jgi:hypothetical protein
MTNSRSLGEYGYPNKLLHRSYRGVPLYQRKPACEAVRNVPLNLSLPVLCSIDASADCGNPADYAYFYAAAL